LIGTKEINDPFNQFGGIGRWQIDKQFSLKATKFADAVAQNTIFVPVMVSLLPIVFIKMFGTLSTTTQTLYLVHHVFPHSQ